MTRTTTKTRKPTRTSFGNIETGLGVGHEDRRAVVKTSEVLTFTRARPVAKVTAEYS